ncbi:signal transducer CD24 [Chiroxiphia lanceolata]|uniref:signal transducer CD24 n=1 Tax=Chiroxiphia lanceolata TaxID=296741 RepID=UPI0013CF2F11|nr:signal transducer CD24 [Chiroxiphia lanceolata]
MGTRWRRGSALGLLLLALLLPTQIYCDPTGTSPSPSNYSSASSTSLSTVTNSVNNTTTHGHGNSLHSTTSLFSFSLFLSLYFCC